MSLEKLKIAESETETNITNEQKETGNYKKGVFEFLGLSIVIENPKGSFRSGVDENGNGWRNEIKNTYGYIKNTIGSDGDELDVFISEDLNTEFVFLVFQTNGKNVFDEHKIMLGFKSKEEAEKSYLSNYDEGWTNYSYVVGMKTSEFATWLTNKKISENEMIEERKKIIFLEGEVKAGETLNGMQEQAGSVEDFDTLEILIASPGGDVSEGIQEMVWANSLTEQGKIVSTVVTANAYSIASLIMLAATPGHRKIGRKAKVMVHNPMKPELTHVNANELEAYVKELRDLEEKMYTIYNMFTGLDRETIKNLMDNETYLNAEDAVKYGFADEIVDIEERPDAVALAFNKEKRLNMKSTLNILNSVIALMSGKEFVNQLYYDTIGGELEIYQKNPAQYEVGDKTNLESGERTLSDGNTVLIEAYTIKDIKKGMEAAEPIDPAVEPVASVDEPLVEPIAEPAVAPIEAPKEEEKPVAVDPCEEPKLPEEEEKVMVSKEMITKMSEKIEALSTKVEALVQTNVSYESKFNELMLASESANKNFEKAVEFENLATQAIDALAKNTASNFKTEPAQVANLAPATGSIFQKLKAQADAQSKKGIGK